MAKRPRGRVAGVSTRAHFVAFMVAIQGLISGQALAQAPHEAEIVVTARRIGVPFWKVTGPTNVVILLPADGTVDGTGAPALTETIRMAKRVYYPGRTSISLSPFKMIGYFLKWRQMRSLPKGQTISAMVGPSDFQRFIRLQQRGLLKKDFDRTHPFPLSVQLKRAAFGEPRSTAASVDSFVARVARQYSIPRVPPVALNSKPVVKAFHATEPRAYVPCLLATVDLVEAGRAAYGARSLAWRQKRIRDVLNSPVDRAFEQCIPPALRPIDRPDVRGDVRNLLHGPSVTVAVVPLVSLAQDGGVLDDLRARGYSIEGPEWK